MSDRAPTPPVVWRLARDKHSPKPCCSLHPISKKPTRARLAALRQVEDKRVARVILARVIGFNRFEAVFESEAMGRRENLAVTGAHHTVRTRAAVPSVPKFFQIPTCD